MAAVKLLGTFEPSQQQPDPSEIVPTHARPFPLPFAIQCHINGETYAARYAGHGQNKNVFVLHSDLNKTFHNAILKLVDALIDQETITLPKLASVGLAPRLLCCGRLQQLNTTGQCQHEWPAWLCEQALPLNHIFQQPSCTEAMQTTLMLMCVVCLLKAK